jgi:hypothetical protein
MVLMATEFSLSTTCTLSISEVRELVDQLCDTYVASNIGDLIDDLPLTEKPTFKPVMQIGKSHPSIFKKKKEVYYIIARRRIA